jgi:hypothetical protein
MHVIFTVRTWVEEPNNRDQNQKRAGPPPTTRSLRRHVSRLSASPARGKGRKKLKQNKKTQEEEKSKEREGQKE